MSQNRNNKIGGSVGSTDENPQFQHCSRRDDSEGCTGNNKISSMGTTEENPQF